MERAFSPDIDPNFLFESLSKNSRDYVFFGNIMTDEFIISENMVNDLGFKSSHIYQYLDEWKEKIREIDRQRVQKVFYSLINQNENDFTIEFQIKKADGRYIWVNCRANIQRDKETGAANYILGILHNLEDDDHIDKLTGIYTYNKGKEDYEAMKTSGSSHGSIMILGIDNFSSINTLNDYTFGNNVLRMITQDIHKLLPESCNLYRFDSDQLLIIGKNVKEEEMYKFYLKIKEYTTFKHEFSDQTYSVTISGGIVSFSTYSDDWEKVIKCSYVALRKSKENGKNKCTIFKDEILISRLRQQKLSELLANSVKNDFRGFKVVYQPICHVSNFEVKGAEALLRYNEGEDYFPDEFIPILEDSRLIIPVGLWVLEQAIVTCKEWIKKCPDFVINVNVSYIQLNDDTFYNSVLELLEKYNLDSYHITLELTEGHFLIDARDMRSLERLRKVHLQIAMDDFGTGYSSIARLTEFNVDIVKIDKSLIQTLKTNSFNYEFVESVIRLCHNAKMKVCVEGVEREEELRIISLFGADYVQGYYVSKPVEKGLFYENFISQKLDSKDYVVSTDKDKKRQELNSDSQLLRSLMNATPLGLIVWSKDFDIIGCNSETLHLLGAKSEMDLSTHFFEYSPKYQEGGILSKDLATSKLNEALKIGRSHFYWIHNHADGHEIHTEVTVVCVEYQEDIILTSYTRDMTKQLEMQSHLEKSSSTIRAILDATPLCLNLWNSKFENTMCNKKAAELFELNNEDEYIEHFDELSPEYQPDGQLSQIKAVEKIKEAFEKGLCIFNWTHCKLNGEEILTEITLVKISGLDISGEDVVAGFTRDLRPQIELEKVQKQISDRMKAVLDATPLCLNLWNSKLENTMCNKKAAELFELKNEDEYIKHFDELSPEYQPDGQLSQVKAVEKIKEAFEKGLCIFNWTHCKLNGEEILTEITLVKISGLDTSGGDVIAGFTRDLRSQIKLEKVQKQITDRMKAVLDATPLMCLLLTLDGEVFDCNYVALKMLKAKNKEEIINNFESFFPHFQPDGNPSIDKKNSQIDIVKEKGYCTFEWVYIDPYQKEIPTAVTMVKIQIEGDEDIVVAYSQDLRELHNTIELNSRLAKLAYYDILTGCSSRSSFMESLEKIFHSNHVKETTSLFIFDLDRFKGINDTFGHEAGDVVLKNVVSKVSSLLPEKSVLGRFGGDEFLILLEDLDHNKVNELMNKIVEEVQSINIIYGDESILCSISIGGVFWKENEDPNNILKRADEALYKAKRKGRNCFVVE